MRDQLNSSPRLARALRIDAAASGAMGLLLAIDGGTLDAIFGLSSALLLGAGLFLVPFAAGLLVLARHSGRAHAFGRLVVAGNVLWIAASLALIPAASATITLLGELFVVAQAAAVALFVYMEVRALRETTPSGVASQRTA